MEIIDISSPEASLIMGLYQLDMFCSSKEEVEEVGCSMVFMGLYQLEMLCISKKEVEVVEVGCPMVFMGIYQLEMLCSSKEEVEVVEVGCPMVCRTEGFLLNTYQEDFTGRLTLVEDNCFRIRLSLERLSLEMLAFAQRTVIAIQE